MDIGIIGINHKSADLELREKLAKAAERLFGPSHSAHADLSFVLLSTCNRTEIYFHSEDPASTHTYLLNAIRERIDEEFEHRIYSYFGIDCFSHLAQVTAGIDSALIGETEIQGQVKRAYEMAHEYHKLAPELHFLFQKCLKIGKNVRSHATLSALPSMEETVLNVATRVFDDVSPKKILFVGLSEINQKIFHLFKRKGCHNITFCNRTLQKASDFARNESLDLLLWANLEKWVDFDLAIFGTKCPHFLIHASQVKPSSACRLVIDLSVPRNVDPKIGKGPTTLLNVDQLNREIDRKRKVKAQALARIETGFIDSEVEKLSALFKLKARLRFQLQNSA